MTRSEKSKEFTINDLHFYTSNGKLVFEYELGSIPTKPILSPLRVDKSNPAFSVYEGKNGIWRFKDHAKSEHSGSYIDFIQIRYNCDFRTAIEKIKGDLGLGDVKILESVKMSQNKPRIVKEKVIIEFDDCPFDKESHKYWNSYELQEQFLRNKEVYRVKKWALQKKIQKIPDNQRIFAYNTKIGCKILVIGENVERKWFNNIQNTYLWNYDKFEDTKVNNLLVCKSYKDNLVAEYLGYNGIATQNESSQTLLSTNVDKINKIGTNIFMAWGSDEQGTSGSIEVTNKTGWYWTNPPKYMLKYGINDFAEYCKTFGGILVDKMIRKSIKKWENQKKDIK